MTYLSSTNSIFKVEFFLSFASSADMFTAVSSLPLSTRNDTVYVYMCIIYKQWYVIHAIMAEMLYEACYNKKANILVCVLLVIVVLT